MILTAFVAGLWPSIAVGTASALAAFYFFLPPYRSFELQFDTVLSLGLFVTVVAVDIAVIHYMYRMLDDLRRGEGAKRRARRAARAPFQ